MKGLGANVFTQEYEKIYVPHSARALDAFWRIGED
jgi:hypothetical protein